MPENYPPSSGGLPPATQIQVTSSLVSAAYKRALRYGTFWKLPAEERAILLLARKLKSIKSPILLEAILRILGKIWPEKAKTFQAFEIGAKVLAHKVNTALKIGAKTIAQALLKAAPTLIPQLGYSYMNTPVLYRPKLEESIK